MQSTKVCDDQTDSGKCKPKPSSKSGYCKKEGNNPHPEDCSFFYQCFVVSLWFNGTYSPEKFVYSKYLNNFWSFQFQNHNHNRWEEYVALCPPGTLYDPRKDECDTIERICSDNENKCPENCSSYILI